MPAYDVVIAGAGPAGAWTAYRLARAGARVALVDGSHPREKPCGGGITGRALELMGDCHLFPRGAQEKGDSPLFSHMTRARFEQEARSVTVPLAPDALAVASRAAFDSALVAAAIAAGAELIPARATDVTVDRGAAAVQTARGRFHAPWVIGADGAAGVTRRKLWRPFRRDQISIATGYFAHGVTSREIVVRFTADPPGYAWSFPRPDHLAIGACAEVEATTAGALKAWTRRWIERADLAGPRARLEPYAWPIPTLAPRDFASERAAGPRWMLVGDAAGLVDPITREGIYFALQSAEAASRALVEGFPADARYQAALRRDVYPELARAARLKSRFFQPRFIGLLMEGLQRPAIAVIMADLVAGRQSYRGLRGRLIRTFELGLAWQFISRGSRRAPGRGARAASL